ncbi:MAG: FAD-dependent oxidoreductase, partial [Planctomycetota bacterium]
GAGFIGLKIACALQKRGLKVTVVEKLDRLMPRMLDKKASSIFEIAFKKKGIHLIFRQGVREIVTSLVMDPLGPGCHCEPVRAKQSISFEIASSPDFRRCPRNDTREKKQDFNRILTPKKQMIQSVKLENGRTVPSQMVIMSVGVKPNIDFLKNSGIKTNQGIIVNEYLQTNIKNIFAAGDVAETIDFLSGKHTINALWPCASAQGKIAGYNMTITNNYHSVRQRRNTESTDSLDSRWSLSPNVTSGGGNDRRNDVTKKKLMRRYVGSLAMNSVEFFGWPVISFGEVNPTGKNYKIITKSKLTPLSLTGMLRSGQAENFYRKLILKENRLVGLILVGQIEQAGIYLSILKRHDEIIDFRL